MKDIMQKLAELEATAPKVTKKKVLREDSTTPPINVSNKPASLKDMFEALSENIAPGQKPLPVLDPQKKQAGMGFVTSSNPSVQNILKNLDPKDVQIMQAPGQTPAAGQQPQATAAGQPAPAGATGQPQAGQLQMKEKDEGKPGKNFAKIAKSAGERYGSKAAGERVAGAVRAKLAKQGKLEEESSAGGSKEELAKEMYFVASKIINYENRSATVPQTLWQQYEKLRATWEQSYGQLGKDVINDAFHLGEYVHWVKDKSAQQKAEAGDKLTYQVRQDAGGKWIVFDTQYNKPYTKGKDDKNMVDILAAKLNSTDPNYTKLKAAANAAPAQPQQKSFMGRMADKAKQVVGMKEAHTGDEAEAKFKKYDKKELDHMLDRAYGKSKPGDAHRQKRAGQAKDAAYDIMWKNKYGDLEEADIPSSRGVDTMGAGLGAGRSMTTLEGIDPAVKEKEVGKIIKKLERIGASSVHKPDALRRVAEFIFEKMVQGMSYNQALVLSHRISEGKKPDFLDLDKDGDKKEPMKKAAADKKKQKVKESMNHRISAARLEGKSHGLRGHAHSGKRYEDIDEIRAYHEGYKEGLDECYGQGVYETAPATPPATVGGMADQEMEEGRLGKAALALGGAAALATGAGIGKNMYDYHKTDSSGYSQADVDKMMGTDSRRSAYDREQGSRGNYRFEEDEMEEGNAFTAALAKTPKGGKFSVGGKTFTDRTGYDAKVNEYAFESLDQQLNALLNESEEVNEGLSVSISKGQQNSPDSVTITAQDQEAEHLLAFVKNAGLGLFGDDNADTHSSAMSVQPSHGAPDEVGAGGIDIGVVDGHDGMMGLMQKLSGIQAGGAEDYADEEGEEQLYGNHETADCNECGTYEGVHEAGCSMGSGKEMVDEVESEDQMEFEVAEDNAPDSGEAESTADEDAEAQEDAALAKSDSKGGTYTVNEDGDEASEEGPESKEGEGDEGAETVSESFANLFRKLAFIAEESTEKEDDKAEKAGKKVAKDIEYDEDHKGKDDDKAEKAGKKVTKDIEYDDKKDKKEKVGESFASLLDRLTKLAEGSGDEPKHPEHDEKDDKDYDDAEEDLDESEQLDELSPATLGSYAKKAVIDGSDAVNDYNYNKDPARGFGSKEQYAKLASDAEKRADKRGKGFDMAMSKLVKGADKEKDLKEWANNAGPGKTVSDTTFEQDIDFMTKVISGGLNKQKSTGQTTIPVIAGQEDRIHDESTNTPANFAKLAGIK